MMFIACIEKFRSANCGSMLPLTPFQDWLEARGSADACLAARLLLLKHALGDIGKCKDCTIDMTAGSSRGAFAVCGRLGNTWYRAADIRYYCPLNEERQSLVVVNMEQLIRVTGTQPKADPGRDGLSDAARFVCEQTENPVRAIHEVSDELHLLWESSTSGTNAVWLQDERLGGRKVISYVMDGEGSGSGPWPGWKYRRVMPQKLASKRLARVGR